MSFHQTLVGALRTGDGTLRRRRQARQQPRAGGVDRGTVIGGQWRVTDVLDLATLPKVAGDSDPSGRRPTAHLSVVGDNGEVEFLHHAGPRTRADNASPDPAEWHRCTCRPPAQAQVS